MVLVGVAAKIYEATGMERWFLSLSRKYDSFETIYKLRHDLLDAHHLTNPRESTMVDEHYVSWLKEHPSALSSFQRMMNASKGKQIAIFLDYDGTLSPIVSDPERAFMSDQMRAAVRDVSKHFPTAIISGRSREKVYNFVKLNEVYYSGSHGMDIMGPTPKNKSCDDNYHHKTVNEEGNEFIVFQPAKDFLPEIQQMLIEMNERSKNIEGVAIEDNRFCLSVHYRHVKDEDYERLEQQVESMLVNHPEFHMTRGKKVLEIRPSIGWNKGHALEYLLDTLGFDDSKNVLPIYIGDDTTDEDAFKVLRERGEGYPILVSSKPRKTMAFHSLRDPSEVLSFLTRLGRWGAGNADSIQA
ncbi:HAD-superfamily hydrolase, subfamily IIB [Artemisia annua]|uniref:Trehalose 6-phosphate phosphatase n=1 Tax=Artemisia annua TaxID=35608 RepID=A0A2U1KK24_ARTAN|nr:HAD-superfamily hydrolase, subfamily IIB [Artemisia annua]